MLGRKTRLSLIAAAALVLGSMLPGARADFYDEDPTSVADVQVVDSASPYGNTIRMRLAGNQKWLFVATGTFSYGPAGTADPECANTTSDPTFRRNVYGTGSGDLLDIVINGYEHDWIAVDPDGNGCSRSHTYTFSGTPATTEWTNLKVLDAYNGDNAGPVTVAIYRVDCEDVSKCVPPKPNPGIPPIPPMPPVPLPVIPPVPPVPPLPTPVPVPSIPGPVPIPPIPSVPSTPTTPTTPTTAAPPTTAPAPTIPAPPTTGPPPTSPVTVPPTPVPAPPTTKPPIDPAPNPLFDSQVSETLVVYANDAVGTMSHQVYQAGRVYDFYVTGRYRYGAGSAMADAECSQGIGDPAYLPARFGTRKLDLTLNGYEFAWTPTGPDPCDPSGTYRLTIVADGTGAVNFKIDDDVYSDNSGQLEVTVVTRPYVVALPNPGVYNRYLETVLLDSRDPLGSFTTNALVPGREYEFIATGEWEWGGGIADSECSFTASDPVGNDYGGNLDLTINMGDVYWQPVSRIPNPGSCSRDLHTYQWQVVVSGSGGNPLLRIRDDSGYIDNAGTLAVFIYEIA